jgi:hypothetical protein
MTVPAVEGIGNEIIPNVVVPRKKRTLQEALRVPIATQEFIIRLYFPNTKTARLCKLAA